MTTTTISRETLRKVRHLLHDAHRCTRHTVHRAGHANRPITGDRVLGLLLESLDIEHDPHAATTVRAAAALIATSAGPTLPAAPADAVTVLNTFADMLTAATRDDREAVAARQVDIWRTLETWITRDAVFCWVQGSAVGRGSIATLAEATRTAHRLGAPPPADVHEARHNRLHPVDEHTATVTGDGRAKVTVETGGVCITASTR